MNDDLLPAYVALIRHELKLETGSDALRALRDRLTPAEPGEKPPTRAPGIARLRRALRDLGRRQLPESPLEQFAEDLRFLQLFAADERSMPEEAMQKLLADVMSASPLRKTPQKPDARDSASTVVPFSGRSPKKRGGE